MILYKYVSWEIGERLLLGRKIKFSDASTFNDPFDIPHYPKSLGLSPEDTLFAGIGTMAKQFAWIKNTGILSLTRTASNPLMWAHYAEQHKGMVVGFDAAAAGWADEATNFVPAQYGSVVYVSSRPTYDFLSKFTSPLAVGQTFGFAGDHYEKIQRLFLLKALCWAYEEEVRVLKCIPTNDAGEVNCESGKFTVTAAKPRPLKLYHVPEGAIREVHLGVYHPADRAATLRQQVRTANEAIQFYRCELDNEALCVRNTALDP